MAVSVSKLHIALNVLEYSIHVDDLKLSENQDNQTKRDCSDKILMKSICWIWQPIQLINTSITIHKRPGLLFFLFLQLSDDLVCLDLSCRHLIFNHYVLLRLGDKFACCIQLTPIIWPPVKIVKIAATKYLFFFLAIQLPSPVNVPST